MSIELLINWLMLDKLINSETVFKIWQETAYSALEFHALSRALCLCFSAWNEREEKAAYSIRRLVRCPNGLSSNLESRLSPKSLNRKKIIKHAIIRSHQPLRFRKPQRRMQRVDLLHQSTSRRKTSVNYKGKSEQR